MSTPESLLAKYRTYTYYHILIVCDTTEAAESLSRSSEIVDFMHARDDNNENKYRAQSIVGGNYIVLINGMTDAQYVIQSVKIGAYITPTWTGEVDHYTTLSLDGEMEIYEPRGIKFFKLIADACSTLNSDPTGLVFLLKTVFVGHTDSGGQETIINIKPLLFTPVDISSSMTETGSQYTMSFVGVTNGTAKMPYASKIARGVTLTFKAGSTLEDAMNTLQARLRDTYNAERQNFIDKYKDKINGLSDLKQVNYNILLDDDYKKAKYVAGSNEEVIKQNKGNGDAILSFGVDVSIERLLDGIMMSSKQVLEERGGVNTDGGKKYTYKIVSTIQSTDKTFDIYYRVVRSESKTVTLKSVTAGAVEPEEGQVIEWDYIFTGNNTDIIEFDMKLELGLAFFQTLGTSKNIPSPSETLNKSISQKSSGTGPITSINAKPSIRRNTPFFLGSTNLDPLIRNAKHPLTTLTFNNLLARQAMLDNIEARIVIHGNPQLMADLIQLPSEIVSGKAVQSTDGVTVATKWTHTPILAKINIRMPATDAHNTEYIPFWYQGFYRIFQINNVFDNDGTFKQEITLFSITQDDPSNEAQDAADNQNVKSQNKTAATGQSQDGDNRTPRDAAQAVSKSAMKN